MNTNRNIENLVNASEKLLKIEKYLEEQSNNMAIVFVDMCNSTQLKQKPQKEWLPIICKFLLTISNIVIESGGKVVKYVGDEVIAIFPEDKNNMATFKAEKFVWHCYEELRKCDEKYLAKYALDYGGGASVNIKGLPQDFLGTFIDRCARISNLVEPDTALASYNFVQKSKNKSSWINLGNFLFKGISKKLKVYQLKDFGVPVMIHDPELITSQPKELVKIINDLRQKLKLCKNELKIHQNY